MSEKQRYRLQSQERQKRLEELSTTDDVNNLASELGHARLLAEEASSAGDLALANNLLSTIGRLSQAQEVACYRRGELLCKQVVLSLALQISAITSEEVKGRFPGWEEAMDRVRQKVITVVSEAKNPEPNESTS